MIGGCSHCGGAETKPVVGHVSFSPRLPGAPQLLTDRDIDRIAKRVVELLAERLAK